MRPSISPSTPQVPASDASGRFGSKRSPCHANGKFFSISWGRVQVGARRGRRFDDSLVAARLPKALLSVSSAIIKIL